jgi:hypothetical protein
MKYTPMKHFLKTVVGLVIMIFIQSYILGDGDFTKVDYIYWYIMGLVTLIMVIICWYNYQLELRDDKLIFKRLLRRNISVSYADLSLMVILSIDSRPRTHRLFLHNENEDIDIDITITNFAHKKIVLELEKICNDYSIELNKELYEPSKFW